MPDTKGSALPTADFAQSVDLIGIETATVGGAKKSVRAPIADVAAKVAALTGAGSGLVAPTILTANKQLIAGDAGTEFVAKAGCAQVVLPDLAGSPSPAAGSLFIVTNLSGGELQFGRAGNWNVLANGVSLTIGVEVTGGVKSYYAIRSGGSGGGALTGPKARSGRIYPLPLDAEPCATNDEAWPGLQFFWPIVWSRPDAQIDQLSTWVTTAGGNARLAIFANGSSTGLPVLTEGAALYDSGAVAMSATGRRSFGTFTTPVTLKAGEIYWLAYATSDAALRTLAIAPFRQNDVNGSQFRDWGRLSMVGLTAALADAAFTDQFNLCGFRVGGTITDPFNIAEVATTSNFAEVTRVPLVMARAV